MNYISLYINILRYKQSNMETVKRGKLCAVWIREDIHKKLIKKSEDKGVHLYRLAEKYIEKGVRDDKNN